MSCQDYVTCGEFLKKHEFFKLNFIRILICPVVDYNK